MILFDLQGIVDNIDDVLPSTLSPDVRERILDHVWQILNDNVPSADMEASQSPSRGYE